MKNSNLFVLSLSGNKLDLDKRAAGEWCRLPYPDHPDGCPNWGTTGSCPPYAPLAQDFFSLTRHHWLVAVRFNLEGHSCNERHPGWKGLECCSDWQHTVREELSYAVDVFRKHRPGTYVHYCPEAMGVDVFHTLGTFGIPIERNPEKWVYKVALVGYLKGSHDLGHERGGSVW